MVIAQGLTRASASRNRRVAGVRSTIIAGFLVSCLVAGAWALAPDPAFYDGTRQHYRSSPTGVIIGYDVTAYVINQGGAGDVFLYFSSGTTVLASRIFAMGAGERVEVTARFSKPPSSTLTLAVREGRPGDTDAGDITVFRLDAAPSVSVAVPQGGETWFTRNRYPIAWQYTGEPGSTVTILLVRGTASTVIATGVSTGYAGTGGYDWDIPAGLTEGGDYRIRITSSAGLSGESPGHFAIRAPEIALTSPGGGDAWIRGTDATVAWDYADNPASTVGISLYRAGEYVCPIAGSAAIGAGGSGSFTWRIPWSVFAGDGYTIRLLSSSGAEDETDAPFSIKNPGSLTVSIPNGGETWYRGQQYTIEWFFPESLGGQTATVELLRAATVERVIAVDVWMGADGFGFTPWEIPPDTAPGSDYAIRVRSSSGAVDASNAPFTIREPSVTVLVPDGGERWMPGNSYQVSWDFAGIDPVEEAKIELLKGGSVDRLIEEKTFLVFRSRAWAVPEDQAPGTDYAVRITTASGFSDTSDRSFTIGIPLVQPLPGYQLSPTDPDGDGIYEDLNANGRLDFADVVLFFSRMQWIADNEPIEAFDLNDNGRIDFADIVALFGEV